MIILNFPQLQLFVSCRARTESGYKFVLLRIRRTHTRAGTLPLPKPSFAHHDYKDVQRGTEMTMYKQ